MKSRTTEDTLALLGGALLGATAMYLLDPETGARRRRQITRAAGACHGARGMAGSFADRAHDMADDAGGSARKSYESAADYARRLASEASSVASDLSGRASDYSSSAAHAGTKMGRRWLGRIAGEAHDQVEHLQDVGHRLWDRARGWMGGVPDAASEQASSLRDDLADRTDDWRKAAARGVARASHRAQSWLGHEEEEGFGTGTLLSSTTACLLLGAGAMYFFDPNRGRARRAWARDKSAAIVRRTGRTMRGMGKDLANRMQGTVHETTSMARNLVTRTQVDSAELINRIRSEVSRLGSRASSVQFMADADGTVTVTGEIARQEVDSLLRLLHNVPGVAHVVNRLTFSEAGASPSSPTPSSAPASPR